MNKMGHLILMNTIALGNIYLLIMLMDLEVVGGGRTVRSSLRGISGIHHRIQLPYFLFHLHYRIQ